MVDIAQVSFAKGELSPIAAARTDLATYQSAAAYLQNFFVRLEGSISNRPGTQFVAGCGSFTPYGSVLVPFVYNNQQAYLIEAAVGTLSVFLNGANIQSGLGTPYTLADMVNLRWAQSTDTLNLTVATQPLAQIKRTTPTTFNFTFPFLYNGPFQDLNKDSTTYMYASDMQGTVTIFCSKPFFTAAMVGAEIQIQEQFLGGIQQWTANSILASNGNSPIGQYCRSDGKIYRCVAAPNSGGGTIATGQFQPVHTQGTQYDGIPGPGPTGIATVVGVAWQYVSQVYGVAKITAFTDNQHVTAVTQFDSGQALNFPPTVVGPPVNLHGPFTFNGDGSTKTFSPLTAITSGDPNTFLVTVGGIFADPSTYTISGTSITFYTPPAVGTGNVVVTQVVGQVLAGPPSPSGSGTPTALPTIPLSTFWAMDSFSGVQGNAGTCVFYNDRLVQAGTTLQPQTCFLSKVSDYLDYGYSVPQIDSDAITFTINARRENPIVDLIALNDLLIGTASAIWRVTHSASVGAITPTDIAVIPQNFYGQQNVPSVQTGDTVIYTQWGGRKIRDLIYQFQYDKYVGQELTAMARHMFPFGTTCIRMAFAPEPYGLLFCVRSDGVLCVCAYLPEQQILGWSHYVTQNGAFEDVCVLPENGGFTVYVIVRRAIGGETVRYIEKFASREYLSGNDAFFVDCGLTYDGRNTSSTAMTVSYSPPVASINLVLVSGVPFYARAIQTAGPHGLTAGEEVTISNVVASGPFDVNGTWTVQSVSSPTVFTIQGAGPPTGSYVGGGNVVATAPLAQGQVEIIASSTAGWTGFQASDVAAQNAIWINDASGNRLCRLRIVQVNSSTAAIAQALDQVPASVLSGSTTYWTFAKSNLAGLTNLQGQMVSVFADGSVQPQVMVGPTGTFNLQNPGGVVHAGLPITAQAQGLQFNLQNQPTIRNHRKTPVRVSAVFDTSSLPSVGISTALYTPPADLLPFEARTFEPMGAALSPQTGVLHKQLATVIDDNATLFVQHTDPTPVTLLSWIVDVDIGEAG